METDQKNLKRTPHRRRKSFRPSLVVMLGFVVIILAGTFFLALPVSSKSGEWTPFIDALLVSASATCVTGYLFAPVGVYFSGFGQVVVLILIQIGGLGFMTVTTFVLLLLRKKISLRDRVALQASVAQDGHKGIKKLVRNILILTFCAEAAGAVLLLPVFVRDFGGAGVWHAIFVSVSAFCNAGVDNFGDGAGIARYASDPYVLLVLALLIILGGLGFVVIADVVKNKGKFSKLSLHSKIALTVSAALIPIGFFFFLGSEFNHSASTGEFGTGTKLLASLFESISCRTAGFSVFPQNTMSGAGSFFRDVLSFIGASPGSTGGGIKTTTFAVLLTAIIAGIRKKDEVVLFRRSVGHKTVYKSLAVVLVAVTIIVMVTLGLLLTEANSAVGLDGALRETIGAFSTAGTGAGLTPGLSAAGKILITVTMFMGRIGMLPVGLMYTAEESDIIRYPEAAIPIG